MCKSAEACTLGAQLCVVQSQPHLQSRALSHANKLRSFLGAQLSALLPADSSGSHDVESQKLNFPQDLNLGVAQPTEQAEKVSGKQPDLNSTPMVFPRKLRELTNKADNASENEPLMLEKGSSDQSAGAGDTMNRGQVSLRELAQRAPWVRAALLGAQDGLVSVTSLMIGVHAISGHQRSMIVSGLAGLVAGACSMAIGEYVSVASERDIELSVLRAKQSAGAEPGFGRSWPQALENERSKLVDEYVAKGLSCSTAQQVADELLSEGHVQEDEDDELPNPFKAAMASAVCFIIGAIAPLLTAAFITTDWIRVLLVLFVSSIMFVASGYTGAWLGGAPRVRSALRTLLGGWVAIAITYCILRMVALMGVQDEARFMEEML